MRGGFRMEILESLGAGGSSAAIFVNDANFLRAEFLLT